MPRLGADLPVALRAGCKVNLNLFITGVRPDGWHELDSLFVPLDEPHDVLRLLPAERAGLSLVCAPPGIDPENNTLTRAYALFAEVSCFAPALKVHLGKGIPQGAGLGGASSDAAALLLWLNAAAPKPLAEEALRAVAARVGADVPFFLQNAPCRALGVGDVLTPCRTGLAGWRLVLVCPPVCVLTAWAYKAFDAARGESLTAGPQTIRWACPGRGECPEDGAPPLYNDFEDVVFAAYPGKEDLLRLGAEGAVMSGSGAAVAALFRCEKAAEAARRACLSRYGAAWVHVCR